ncbi:MAG: DUF3568 family protein [Gemmataceae bacterium]
MPKRNPRRWLYLGVALLALSQSGCAVAILGAAAGGAALGYAYLRAALSRDYPALLGDTIRATKIALGELGFPITIRSWCISMWYLALFQVTGQ